MSPTKPPPDILDTEWDLLEALWSAERATARQVADALAAKRGWAYSTVKTLLDRMVDKGLVAARQVGPVWEYTPAVSKPKAQRWAWRRFVGVAFGGAVAPSVAFVAKEAKLSKGDREAIRRALHAIEGDDE